MVTHCHGSLITRKKIGKTLCVFVPNVQVPRSHYSAVCLSLGKSLASNSRLGFSGTSAPVQMYWWNLSSCTCRFERICSRRQGLEELAVALVGLHKQSVEARLTAAASEGTYKWQPAVCAHAYLWLVYVDEDSRMAQWSTSSIARYNALFGPAHWLLVNELNGCERAWLGSIG